MSPSTARARTLWTTWGRVRGCCGHAHRTSRTAAGCLERDARGCASQGGYSDRELRRCHRGEIAAHDVNRGPGAVIR